MLKDGIRGLWRVDKPYAVVPLLGSEPMLVELGALLGFRDDGRVYDLVQICGDSMRGAGILDGDYALADPCREAVDQDIVLAYVEGEPTVKRLRILDGRYVLVPENPDYLPMMGESIQIAAVVTSTMRIHC
jgi:hypothetical protein